MTKAEHKKLIIIKKGEAFKEAYYADLFCGTYTKSWSNAEIREDVYTELKARGQLI